MTYKGEKAKQVLNETLAMYDNDKEQYTRNTGTKGYFKNEIGTYTAFDNTTGDCWVEDFDTEKQAKNFIK